MFSPNNVKPRRAASFTTSGGWPLVTASRATEFTSRPARDGEVARGLQFLGEMQKEEGLTAEKSLDRFCLLLLNLNEFMYLD